MAALPLWFLAVAAALLGAIWGSFIAALCSRWPKGESVARGRSCCDHCGTTIAAYDLVPIFSWIALRGKCRSCGGTIARENIAIEIAAVAIGLIPALFLTPDVALGTAIFGWLLLPIAILDAKHLWLPTILVLALAFAGFLAGPLMRPDLPFTDRAIAALAGYASLEIVRRIYTFVRHREGMGAGDPKLFGALGIWVGWQALPILLLTAAILGLIAAAIYRLAGKSQPAALPLGSLLCIAAAIISVDL